MKKEKASFYDNLVFQITLSFLTTALVYYSFDDIVISIFSGLTVFSIFFFVDQKFKWVKAQYPEAINLFISVMATTFGVYLALSLEKSERDNDDRQMALSLTETCQNEFLTGCRFASDAIDYTRSHFYHNDSAFIDDQLYYTKRGLQPYLSPIMISTLLSNNLYIRYCHPAILNYLIATEKGIKNIYGYLSVNTFKTTDDYIRFMMPMAVFLLGVNKVLDVQKVYLRKEVSFKEAERQADLIFREFNLDALVRKFSKEVYKVDVSKPTNKPFIQLEFGKG